MPQIEASSIIHAPPERVWHTLNDIDHTPQWVIGLEGSERLSQGDYGLGSRYIDYNRLGPILQKTVWRVTEFDPMTHQAHVSDSQSLPSTLAMDLSPTPEGTLLRFSVSYRFLPVLGPLSRLFETLVMNRALTQVFKQNLQHLDRYLQEQSISGA